MGGSLPGGSGVPEAKRGSSLPPSASITAVAAPENVGVFSLEGDFDLANVPELEESLLAVFGSGTPTVVVDLSGVTFLDSTMLRAMVTGRRQAEEQGGRLLLVRPQPMLWRVFEVVALDQVFSSYESLAAALDAASELE